MRISDQRCQVAVVGAGAVGGLLAAELHAAGAGVTLCARHVMDRLIVQRERAGRDFPVYPPGEEHDGLTVVTNPERVCCADWIVVALKAQDSAAAAGWLARLVDERSVVVVVQNGIEHRERVGPLCPKGRLIPALANTAVERTERGRLVHRAGDTIVLPEEPGAQEFASLLQGSALHALIESDFTTAAWRKLLSNLAANPITALTMRRAEVFAEPGIRELSLALLHEAVAVGRAEGAALSDRDPERTLAGYDELPRDSGSSMLYDRLAGRPLEVDPITGALVRAARRHDLRVPLNDAILALLDGLDGAQREPRATK